jgi:hypothetical protein
LLEGVSTVLVDHDGALEVGVYVAGSRSTGAGSPVNIVDLEKSNIVGSVGVVVGSVGVSSALVLHDALTTLLVPSVLVANGGDVLVAGGGSAGALLAIIGGAVSTAGVGPDEGNSEEEDTEGTVEGVHLVVAGATERK